VELADVPADTPAGAEAPIRVEGITGGRRYYLQTVYETAT